MLSLANQHLAVTSISIHPNQQSSQSAANLSIYQKSSFKKNTFQNFSLKKYIFEVTPPILLPRKYIFKAALLKNTFLKSFPQKKHFWNYFLNIAPLKIHFQNFFLKNMFSKFLPQKYIFKIALSLSQKTKI